MTGREALILIITEGLIAAIAICIAWHYAAEVERLKGEHAARARVRAAEARVVASLRRFPPLQEHKGRHAVVPEPRRRLPLTEQVIKREDAPGRPPWFQQTAPIPAVPAVPALAAAPEPTDEQTHDLYFAEPVHGPLAVPAPASSFPCCRHCTPPCETHHVACMDCQPGFGTDRCEADVLAAEDGAQPVMLP